MPPENPKSPLSTWLAMVVVGVASLCVVYFFLTDPVGMIKLFVRDFFMPR